MRNELEVRRILESLVCGILETGNQAVLDGSFYEQMAPHVDAESTAVVSPEELVRSVCQPGHRLLDFGCGTGAYRSMLEQFGYDWYGVNYREGMQREAAAAAEAMGDPRISFYDGQVLPFDSQFFDVVYSFQTFEHIQSIPVTFAELSRVLKPGGSLIGAVSYLEQIHDYSTFNFTPYGLKLAATQAGFELLRIYPRCDVFTFLVRRLLVVTSGSDDNSLSPVLQADNAIGHAFLAFGRRLGLTTKEGNLLRLMFSVHFAFHAVRLQDVIPAGGNRSECFPQHGSQ